MAGQTVKKGENLKYLKQFYRVSTSVFTGILPEDDQRCFLFQVIKFVSILFCRVVRFCCEKV